MIAPISYTVFGTQKVVTVSSLRFFCIPSSFKEGGKWQFEAKKGIWKNHIEKQALMWHLAAYFSVYQENLSKESSREATGMPSCCRNMTHPSNGAGALEYVEGSVLNR